MSPRHPNENEMEMIPYSFLISHSSVLQNLPYSERNIGTQSVQELFFCDSIRRTVYSNDLVEFFWLRCTARKKLGIYDVHTMLHR